MSERAISRHIDDHMPLLINRRNRALHVKWHYTKPRRNLAATAAIKVQEANQFDAIWCLAAGPRGPPKLCPYMHFHTRIYGSVSIYLQTGDNYEMPSERQYAKHESRGQN